MIRVAFDRVEVGRRIAKRRKLLKIRQNVLAERVNINNNHLSNIETGKVSPSMEVFVSLCNELQITPDYLLEGAMHSNNVPQNIADHLRLCTEEDIQTVAELVRILADRRTL